MDLENLKVKKIKDISNLLEKGQLCPEELTHYYLDKIYRDSRSKDVFTNVLKKSALDSAKEAKKSKYFQEVYVSSDSKKILDICKHNKIKFYKIELRIEIILQI